MAGSNSSVLKFLGYEIERGIVSLQELGGAVFSMPVRELAASADLIASLSPADAFKVGNWHANYVERLSHPELSPGKNN